MIVIQDSSSDIFTYGIPNIPEIPVRMFSSYAAAKKALVDIVENFEEFIPVAYGKAYPYEKTTFDNEIDSRNFALIGWIIIVENDTVDRIPIGLIKITEDIQQAS
jgi:hypothetical protein